MDSRKVYKHSERHYVSRTGWLRAAVLGANDGIISVSSLVIGVAAASTTQHEILVAGVAGLVAGAMSMAAGEYVSVSSQTDLEKADLSRERKELVDDHENEVQELADIYIDRGVEPDLARTVSMQMMKKDALGVHAREELGISDLTSARPLQAAGASAIAFSLGAVLPVLATFLLPTALVLPVVSVLSVLLLGVLGAIAAHAGGAGMVRPALRVMFWGVVAMGATALIGRMLGTVIV
jgi:VIT1/CCC1 family predicted Fe2+/Mn2+ transporter